MTFTAATLRDHLHRIYTLHAELPRKPSKAFRKWDGRTPYATHPAWAGLTILSERTLPEELRLRGALTLFYHDILEDTTAELPADLPAEVIAGIEGMTFRGGSAEEYATLFERPIEIQLLKLYDKTSNLLDLFDIPPAKRTAMLAHITRLIAVVEQHYGPLNIVHMARTFLALRTQETV